MSPILVRPVREQFEHDRVIRALQLKFKRKYDVAVNIGAEQGAPLKVGKLVLYPDLVLTTTGRDRKVAEVIEVETAESVNYLEALAQWAHFGRSRVGFALYVPAGSVDQARRLCADHAVSVDEIWGFHVIGGQSHFTLVQRAAAKRSPVTSGARSASASRSKPAARAKAKAATGRPKAGAKKPAKATAKTAKKASKVKPGRSRKR